MERIAFLIPPDDQQLFCMLNPESVVIHRNSGIISRPMIGSASGCHDQSRDSLLYDGSQMTIIDLRLLFDTTLDINANVTSPNVREITGKLFSLAGPSADGGGNTLSIVRMIWGKSWSVPGIVLEISERLDYFNEFGEPRRSWVSLRLLVIEDVHDIPERIQPEVVQELIDPAVLTRIAEAKNETEEVKSEQSIAFNDRLDTIAHKTYGAPGLWKVLAEYNNLESIIPPVGESVMIKVPSMETLMKGKRDA